MPHDEDRVLGNLLRGARTDGVETPGADCPEEDEIAAFAEGRLTARRRTQLQPHVFRCARCQEVVRLVLTGPEIELMQAGGPAPESPAGLSTSTWLRSWIERLFCSGAGRLVLAGGLAGMLILALGRFGPHGSSGSASALLLAGTISDDQVVDTVGAVEVCPAGGFDFVPAKPGTALLPGTRVRIGQGAGDSARILLHGKLHSAGPGEVLTVTPPPPSTTGRPEPWLLAKLQSVKDDQAFPDVLVRGGSASGRDADRTIDLTGPLPGRLRQTAPTFRWSRTGPGSRVDVVLRHESAIVWSVSVTGSQAASPHPPPPLARGEIYEVEVTAPGAGQVASASGTFEVAAQDAVDRLDRQLASVSAATAKDPALSAFLAGAVAEHEGFLDEARAHYEKAAGLVPGSRLYRKALDSLIRSRSNGP